jgi:purple acid phosphatase-like protein/calcineurin-like phosphoesterase family protein
MHEATRRGSAGRAGLVAAAIAAILAASATPAHAFAAQLRRSPYLTDAEDAGTTVNWGTDRTVTSASVKWGGPGEACTAHTAAASRTSITVNGVAEYQWSARITGLAADTRYCYRVFGGTTDLLGTDASPSFSSPIAAGATTPFSFAVFGDWGLAPSAAGNPGQAAVLSRIAQSGARFALTTGDTGYPSGSQTNYGDLLQTGANVSGVFGPSFWTIPGTSVPLFSTLGNHGVTTTFLQNWPETSAAASSGGRFQAETYCCLNGTTSASYPSAWYAFTVGNARFYVLDAAWADSNPGTVTQYQDDFDYHWAPGSPEVQWLRSDLASHPTQLKFAFFHYPLYVDNKTETSDTFLQGQSSLEGLLSSFGVNIAFNGHAHVYERNTAGSGGLVSYVTGGGGGTLEPVSCGVTRFAAAAIGWSPTSSTGTACGTATKPTSANQVYHFLLVSVNGSTVTVTPTNADGGTFDVQTYTFGAPPPPPVDNPPTAPTDLVATAAGSSRINLTWSASTDDVGVASYEIYRDGSTTPLATVGGTTLSYSDTAVGPAETHSYVVKAVDTAGHHSDPSNTASATTSSAPPAAPAFVRDATGSTPSGTSLTVPLTSTAGDALVASVAIQAGSTASVTGVGDTSGGTWTRGSVGFLAGSSTRVELWYRTGGAAVSGVTVTLSTTKAASADVAEFSGVASTGALDAAAGNTGTATSTTAPTPPVTTTNASDVLVGAVNYPSSTISATLDPTGFTALSPFTVSTVNGRAAYRVVSAPGAYSTSWTLSAAANSGGAILALKGA